MGIDWKRADTDGWDIEDVDRARTVADTCPRCGQASRLVERERVKNLSIFGVALVATERGGRVFECTLCNARFEVPDGGVEREEDLDASVIDQLTSLHDQLDAVEEDLAVWQSRVTLAARSSDAVLARDAQEMFERRSRAAASLRAEIEGLGKQLRKGSAADETAQAPARRGLLAAAKAAVGIVEEKAVEQVAAVAVAVEDELAALRQKVAAKAVAATSAAPTKEDELTALKRRLGMIPAEGAAKPKAAEEAPVEAAVEVAGGAEQDAADDEVAALKRKLRGTPAPAAASAPESAPKTDDDEMADLKNKLRPKR